jgi:hypothetical protein
MELDEERLKAAGISLLLFSFWAVGIETNGQLVGWTLQSGLIRFLSF